MTAWLVLACLIHSLAEPSSLETLVAGLNAAAQDIHNGEIKVLRVEVRAPRYTSAESHRRLEELLADAQRQMSSSRIASGSNAEDSDLTELRSILEAEVQITAQPTVIRREYDIAFQIHSHEPLEYQYRATVLDRRNPSPQELITQFRSIGWQRIVIFDGELQLVVEELQNGVRQDRLEFHSQFSCGSQGTPQTPTASTDTYEWKPLHRCGRHPGGSAPYFRPKLRYEGPGSG